MVEMALMFLGFTLLIFLLGMAAAAYYVPKVLDTESDHGEEPPESGGQTT
jgi:hypothetical protein